MMNDQAKSKKVRTKEIETLKRRIQELEQAQARLIQGDNALRETEETFRNLIENAPDAIYVHADARFLYLNPMANRLFGTVSADELIGSPLMDRFHPSCHAMIQERLHLLYVESKTLPAVEQTYVRMDGSLVPVEAQAVPITYNHQKAFLTFARDISERKRAEEALRENEERYRLIAENTADLISILDMNMRFTYISPATMRLRGFTVEEAMEQTLEQVLTPESMRIGLATFEEEMQLEANGTADPERTRILELEEYKKDGSIICMEVSLSFLRDRNGKPVEILIVSRDITERKRGEEALRASEERWKFALEGAGDGLWDWDAVTNRVYFSKQWKAMLGYADDEIDATIDEWDRRVHPDDKVAVYADLDRLFHRETGAYMNEHRLLCKDGSYKWILDRGKVIEWTEDGKPRRVIGTHTDIAERKRVEQEIAILAEIRQLISSTLEIDEVYERFAARVRNLIPCDRLSVNLQNPHEDTFTIAYVSGFDIPERRPGTKVPKAGSLSEVVTRMRTGLLVHPESPEEMMRLFPNATALTTVRAGMQSVMGVPLISRDEVIGTLQFRSKKQHAYTEQDLRLAERIGAQIAGAIVNAQLFNDLSKAEKSLRESEGRLRDVIFSIADWVWEVDESGVYTYSSRKGFDLLGVSRQDIIGKTPFDLMPPDEAKKVSAIFSTIAANKAPIKDLENWNIRRNGERICLLTNGVPILDEEGNLKGYRGVDKDITDRKRAEEERQVISERLQHADKMEAVGTLAGGIAHDFNNLLMGIQGYASLMLLNLAPSHPHYGGLKMIEEQVQSGADLTRQLLGFARGGRYEVKPADMNDFLEKSSSLFGRTRKEISIHRKYGNDLWTVEVDRGQLEQVFVNLYVNAWQAMPGGGMIYLETENVILDEARVVTSGVEPGRYVKIAITDTGIGMDAKTRERIFDPFFTTKAMGRGTGLGLATVYGIITGHKGMINVSSEPGHGTTFTIYLPASEKEAVEERRAAGAIARGTETILVVDDEEVILQVTRELLESIGYRVYQAMSGQAAIAVYMEKRNEIDLVMLDMIMPWISGSETFDRLREINPDIKVLLSSGYSIEGRAQKILDRGCNGFIQKPFQLEKLSRKIREMLG